MCYFDQQLWPCGYWRWGQFREQCPKEYRTGETCGLRLVFTTYMQPDQCKTCDTVMKKERRMGKMYEDVDRWSREGGRRATIERTLEEISELQAQVNELRAQHEARRRATNY